MLQSQFADSEMNRVEPCDRGGPIWPRLEANSGYMSGGEHENRVDQEEWE